MGYCIAILTLAFGLLPRVLAQDLSITKRTEINVTGAYCVEGVVQTAELGICSLQSEKVHDWFGWIRARNMHVRTRMPCQPAACQPAACSANAPCSSAGDNITFGSAGDLLVAGRFAHLTDPAACHSGAAGESQTPRCAVPSASGALPWVVPDFEISMAMSSSRIDVQRNVSALAHVDLFLCNNTTCEVAADLQYVSPGLSPATDGQDKLAMAYSRLEGTTVGLPLLYLNSLQDGTEARGTRVPEVLAKSLPEKIQKQTRLVISRVVYQDDANWTWLETAPSMAAVGVWARAMSTPGGLNNLRVGTYRTANMGNRRHLPRPPLAE
jgi:hypothetical protein